MRVDDLSPGDLLAYAGSDFAAWLVSVKTWSRVTHVEIYAGHGLVWTARQAGVHVYDYTERELVAVRRPILGRPLDVLAMSDLASASEGQAYDLIGLLRFFRIGTPSTDRQFCSEYVTRLYRAGRFEPFQPDVDAETVSPGMYLTAFPFRRIWEKP